MSNLETAREKFYSALEYLKKTHTREELEAQMEKIKGAREELWEIDPDFRHMIKEKRRRVAAQSDNVMAPHIARAEQARREADEAKAQAEIIARKR